MPDWVGLDGSTTAARYRAMALQEVHGISPSYERLCLGVSTDTPMLARLDSLPPEKRQPNLLLGAVRYLDGPVDDYAEFRGFVLDGWDAVSATMLARRTQTNEPGRCACLMPVLARLPQPLALVEVGASAGLCLVPDRYRYRYATRHGVVAFGDSPVALDCMVTGPAPLPESWPDVVWRAGLDLAPLDVASDDDVRWLSALIWPEQTDRLARLHAAVAVARADPPRIDRGDLLTDLPRLARDAPPHATLVVFHSAVLAYVDPVGRAQFTQTMHELAAYRPTAWLSNEAPGVTPGTAVDTGGRSRFVLALDGHPLGLSGPHGQSLEWFG